MVLALCGEIPGFVFDQQTFYTEHDQVVQATPGSVRLVSHVNNQMINLRQPPGGKVISIGGYNNVTLRNNELTNTANNPVSIQGRMPHGASYWEDNGVTDPTREDYVYHLEYNYIHDYGQGILSDFGAVHSGKFVVF